MTLFIRCPSPDVAKLHLFWGEITPLTPFIRPFIGVITPFYNHPKGPTLYFFPKGKNAWIFSKSYIELTHSADFTLAKRGVSFEFLFFFHYRGSHPPKKSFKSRRSVLRLEFPDVACVLVSGGPSSRSLWRPQTRPMISWKLRGRGVFFCRWKNSCFRINSFIFP